MGTKSGLLKFVKIIGLLYFIINLSFFTIIFLFALKTINDIPTGYSPGWVFLSFPGIGMLSGYWLYFQKLSKLRIFVMIASLIASISFVFIFFYILPNLENHPNSTQESAKKKSFDDKTALFFKAVDENNLTFLRKLLDQGIDVNSVDELQATALHRTNNQEVLLLLINRGANIEALDDQGMTPIFHKDINIADLLVSAGANINARSLGGNTPFMWYCYSGYLEGMKYLVERGCEVNVCNNDGNNAKYIVGHFQPNTEGFHYVMSLDIKDCR